MRVYEPTVEPDEHRLGTPADKQRMVDFRDSQLLLALKKNGWPSNVHELYLGLDGKRKFGMVYTHIVESTTQAVAVGGSAIPQLVIRTDGKEWRVIHTRHTSSAAEASVREQHNELDLEPLGTSTKFGKADRILFVSIRSEPQTVRFHLPFGSTSVLEIKTDGQHWIPSFSKIDGRDATPQQQQASRYAIPLSVTGDNRVIPQFAPPPAPPVGQASGTPSSEC